MDCSVIRSSSDTSAVANTPLLDATFLSQMVTATGPEAFRDIAAVFWEMSDELFADLQEACASGDARVRHAAAHTFRGSAANVGAGRMAQICQLLEHPELSDPAPLLAQLRAALDETPAALDDALQRWPAGFEAG